MSDQSETGSEASMKFNKNDGDDDEICRDFLRNVCKRGSRCRYRHLKSDEARMERNAKNDNLTFCHDYQNTSCRRATCKFLHCTREEEDHYRQTGHLPLRIQQAHAMGISNNQNSDLTLNGEVPVCKDNLKGNCKRGSKCKYRHVSSSDIEHEFHKSDHRNNNTTQNFDRYERDFRDGDRFDSYEFASNGFKRRRTELYGGFESRYSSNQPISFQLLEEENAVLRRKVEELKKQVADLTATNEVLLEQNARYRVSSRTALGANAAAAAPQSLNHLATSLAQQIALNSELASQHALQQRIARELAPAAAAAQGPTMNQSAVTLNPIVPVSLSQNTLSGLGPVSMDPQQQTVPHGQQTVSVSQAIPQNLAQNPSTTLVSYPIVSQNLRTASTMAL